MSVIDYIKLLSFLTEQITASLSALILLLLKCFDINVRVMNVAFLIQLSNDWGFRRTLQFEWCFFLDLIGSDFIIVGLLLHSRKILFNLKGEREADKTYCENKLNSIDLHQSVYDKFSILIYSMKVIHIQKYGRSPILTTCPLPVRNSGQILVKMKYAPINPSDLNFYTGSYGIRKEHFPIMGF